MDSQTHLEGGTKHEMQRERGTWEGKGLDKGAGSGVEGGDRRAAHRVRRMNQNMQQWRVGGRGNL